MSWSIHWLLVIVIALVVLTMLKNAVPDERAKMWLGFAIFIVAVSVIVGVLYVNA